VTKDRQRPWRIFVLCAGVVSIVQIQAPLIAYKTFANVDEAYAGALAERLLEGHKLYQGAISQRGPLMYYAFEGMARLHGWDNIVAVRLWGLALTLAHLFLVYWAGKRLLLSKTAAAIAAAVTAYALSFGFPPSDAFAINGESLQLPALMLAVVLGAEGARAPPSSAARRRWLLLAGLSLGVAVSIKQSVALHPLPILVWLAVDAHRRRASWGAVAGDALALALGVALVPSLLLAHAAMDGTLRDFVYYTVTYNRQVHLSPSSKTLPWLSPFFIDLATLTLFFIGIVFVFARALPFFVRRVRAWRSARSAWALARAFGPAHYVGLHLVVALASATSMYRFFPHYYLQASPFLALSFAAAVDRVFRLARTAWPARVVAGSFMFFTMFASALGCVFGEKIDGRVSHDRTVQDMGRMIAATTAPEDRIFVWGFSSWLYQYAHRRPAGRYVFETYVTGFVPWFWDKLDFEKARIVPGSVEALLGDLDREQPKVVVDAGSIMMARPMRMYEKPNAWLHAYYCFEARIGALDMYRRKENDADPCPTPFPRVHETVDWNGRTMSVPIPRTLDFDSSPPLPRGNPVKPIWFPQGPPPKGLAAALDKRLEKEEAEGEAEGFYVPRLEDK
jgi:4-amino-4-deoxy-L-arabinose transferase-like glycosyltransferase